MIDGLASMIRTDVERLCAGGNRDLGTAGNRAATSYVLDRMHAAGLTTEELPFEVPEWRFGSARVTVPGLDVEAHPGPFSPPADVAGTLVVIRSREELEGAPAAGAVLLLLGEIAACQLTPRGYPFYANPDDAALLDALEAARPLAVLAATGSCAMTGAMSPFPLIEDTRFAVPHAYLAEAAGEALARFAGRHVSVTVDSEVRASTGVQPIGRLGSAHAGRIVVSAHVDAKPETAGAIDNAAGVAVLLAVADALAAARPARTVEFVPFNGEDHVLAPGELAWLGRNPDVSDVRFAVNLDAPGLPGAPSAYSLYGVDGGATDVIAAVAARHPDVAVGPQWPASDHMVFAMRGVPSMAITSTDFETASRVYSHTPADTPDILDYDLLAATARFVIDLIAAL